MGIRRTVNGAKALMALCSLTILGKWPYPDSRSPSTRTCSASLESGQLHAPPPAPGLDGCPDAFDPLHRGGCSAAHDAVEPVVVRVVVWAAPLGMPTVRSPAAYFWAARRLWNSSSASWKTSMG